MILVSATPSPDSIAASNLYPTCPPATSTSTASFARSNVTRANDVRATRSSVTFERTEKRLVDVFAISDVHADVPENARAVRAYVDKTLLSRRRDGAERDETCRALVVAGTWERRRDAWRRVSREYKRAFDVVCYLPAGNHELWCEGRVREGGEKGEGGDTGSYPNDSIGKMWRLIDLCTEFDVSCAPIRIGVSGAGRDRACSWSRRMDGTTIISRRMRPSRVSIHPSRRDSISRARGRRLSIHRRTRGIRTRLASAISCETSTRARSPGFTTPRRRRRRRRHRRHRTVPAPSTPTTSSSRIHTFYRDRNSIAGTPTYGTSWARRRSTTTPDDGLPPRTSSDTVISTSTA